MQTRKSIAAGLFLAVAALAMAAVASTATAAPITLPTTLSPGDQYRLAFVTSTTRNATSTDIADYNDFVTDLVNDGSNPELVALGTTWKVIGSTSSISARDNTDTLPDFDGGSFGVPIFLLNNTKLADTYDDLWDGDIDAALAVDESGANNVAEAVFTGTSADGTPMTVVKAGPREPQL